MIELTAMVLTGVVVAVVSNLPLIKHFRSVVKKVNEKAPEQASKNSTENVDLADHSVIVEKIFSAMEDEAKHQDHVVYVLKNMALERNGKTEVFMKRSRTARRKTVVVAGVGNRSYASSLRSRPQKNSEDHAQNQHEDRSLGLRVKA